MKKTGSMLLIAGAMALAPSLHAQEGGCSKNLRFSLGYGLPALGGITEANDITIDPAKETMTTTLRNISLGQGMFLEGAFGCMFTENVGIDAALSYQMGTANKIAIKSDEEQFEQTITGNVFRITPSLVFAAPGEKITPYARVGLPICFSSGVITATGTGIFGGNNVIEMETKESFRPSVGLSTALGVRYGLGEKMGLFAEFNMISQSAIQSRSEWTKMTVDGRDQLGDATTSDKITEYEKEFVETENTNKNDGEPSKDIATRLPFSSAGFRIGIQINL